MNDDIEHLNGYQKLDWISFAIQEALNGNDGELMQALELVEALREKETTQCEKELNNVRNN